MDGFDVVMLSRIQFALTIAFHYIFPPLSIGLGLLMVLMEGLYLKTRDPIYERMAKFWTRIFGVNFAMGVASGIVMEFQFGTNWSSYSRYVGDVFGSALAAEGIFAFFLESGFLAILVFGWDRVSSRMHFVSTVMVALGAMFSSGWIVVANSWQQTPAGHHIVTTAHGARAEIVDFWSLVFNPSSMPRLAHVLLGAYILASFFVMSISAYYILRGRHLEMARRSFTIALIVGAIASIIVPFSGHTQAVIVAEHQPAKLAAFEGHYATGVGAPVYLFGIPDDEAQRVDLGVAIPGMLSWLTYGDAGRRVTGLDAFVPADRPPVRASFFSYHAMVGLGIAFLALSFVALVLRGRNTLFGRRWLMWVFVFAVIGPYLANQLGWMAAEVGRQPWVVYGLLRTTDGVSQVVPAGQVLASIVIFGVVYLMLFAVWVFVLHNKIAHGPDEPELIPQFATGSFIAAASSVQAPGGPSLTDAHDESRNDAAAPEPPRKRANEATNA
jgi:cytochrome d ubiquinol oxidase subunit I